MAVVTVYSVLRMEYVPNLCVPETFLTIVAGLWGSQLRNLVGPYVRQPYNIYDAGEHSILHFYSNSV